MIQNVSHTNHISQKKDQNEIIDLLKINRLSVTNSRLVILGLLINQHGPFSVEEILKKIPKNTCDQATVYRTLSQFIDIGIVTTIHLEKDLIHYEFKNPNHHHHHLFCKNCKKIESLEFCFSEKIEVLIKNFGYSQIDHKLEFFGICPNCQEAS